MGMDLRLLPFDNDGHFPFSHTMLDCARDYDLFEAVGELPALPVPDSFVSFSGRLPNGETGYGKTVETPYGKRLLYTTVEYLLRVKHLAQDGKNKAGWAYLEQLEPLTKVALYWH